MPEELVRQWIELPSGELSLLQPEESAALPDAGAVEWAPIAPYWSVLWRSGVALARELDGAALRGLRVVELGCGLGVPSIAAARAGAHVLATDACGEALALVTRNGHLNGVRIETATVDWAEPDELVRRAPFDLVLAADVLYERAGVAPLLALLPRLAPQAWFADPGRPRSISTSVASIASSASIPAPSWPPSSPKVLSATRRTSPGATRLDQEFVGGIDGGLRADRFGARFGAPL